MEDVVSDFKFVFAVLQRLSHMKTNWLVAEFMISNPWCVLVNPWSKSQMSLGQELHLRMSGPKRWVQGMRSSAQQIAGSCGWQLMETWGVRVLCVRLESLNPLGRTKKPGSTKSTLGPATIGQHALCVWHHHMSYPRRGTWNCLVSCGWAGHQKMEKWC